MDTGSWRRNQRGGIFLLDEEAPVSFPPPNARVLTLAEVSDPRIDKPAQAALVRLSRKTATAAAAATLFDFVRRGRLAGIHCMNSTPADKRAQRLGSSAQLAIASPEEAVLLLDPTDLRDGAPMMAFNRALHPGCGLEKGQKSFPAQDDKLDKALLRAFANYQAWHGGLQLGRPARCGLIPIHAVSVQPALKLPGTILNGVLPRFVCQASAIPATPGTPKLVRHRHTLRICTLESFEPQDDPPEMDLLPANMTPRFVAPDDSLITFPPLQDKLVDVLVNQFKQFLTPQSVRDRKANAGDRIRVALVDLTDHKLCRPQLAGFGATVNEEGASTAKILLFYAAHQMLFDLQSLARREGLRTRADLIRRALQEWATFTCFPDLDWLFTITPGTPAASVEFSAAHRKLLEDIIRQRNSTPNAAILVMKLSFEYIASAAWQSGLRHPLRGGLWFGSTYCRVGDPDKLNPKCHERVIANSGCDAGESRIVWKNDPLKIGRIRGSALSCATYMTLLAQGRLVNADMSRRIESFLVHGCQLIGQTALGGTRTRAAKCGVTSLSFHDVALMEHGTPPKKRRWVLAFMSRGLNTQERKDLLQLVPAVHDLIVGNNP